MGGRTEHFISRSVLELYVKFRKRVYALLFRQRLGLYLCVGVVQEGPLEQTICLLRIT